MKLENILLNQVQDLHSQISNYVKGFYIRYLLYIGTSVIGEFETKSWVVYLRVIMNGLSNELI